MAVFNIDAYIDQLILISVDGAIFSKTKMGGGSVRIEFVVVLNLLVNLVV